MTGNRVCPRSYPDAPHEMRQDSSGRWYCPIERDAELAAEYVAQLESLTA